MVEGDSGEPGTGGRVRVELILALGSLLLAILLAEVLLRAAGFRPWETPQEAESLAIGAQLYRPDPSLGYANVPGATPVSMRWGHQFVTTVDAAGRRITGKPGAAVTAAVWVFGGSFTYGWLVDDLDTYAARMQAALPDRPVLNFGTNGYGTLQSLLQLEGALDELDRPAAVVLAYASFHDIRNTAPRMMRKGRFTATPLLLPRGLLDANGELEISMVPLAYSPVPLARVSALAQLLDESYNRLESRLTPSHEVSRAIIRRMVALCREHDVEFLLAGLSPHSDTLEMLAYWSEQGVHTVDITVDTSDPLYSFVPNDNHPRPAAHELYAARLVEALGEILEVR